MKVVIDRFEGSFAVCEKYNKEIINIEKSKLPGEAKEGDVLDISKDAISIDEEETSRRKKEIDDLAKDLWD